MIVPFLFIALGLLALILLLFRKAIWGSHTPDDRTEEESRLALFRLRSKELGADAETAAVREAIHAESERDLLGELQSLDLEPRREPSKGSKVQLLLSLAVVMTAAAGLYLHFGRPDLLDRPPLSVRQDADRAIRHLAEQLEAQPNNPDGWVLLGRSLVVMQRPLEAARAYEFAIKLKPGDPEIRLAYADALAASREGNLSGQPIEMIREVLKHHPKQRYGLWLAGLEAAQSERYPEALTYWRQLRREMEDGADTGELDGYIQELESRIAQAPVASDGLKIRVRVRLSKSLKGKSDPQTRVFVFAKATNGPPMPLAVAQKTVADLPFEIELNDQMAMVPGRTLSSAEEIILGARISKTGKPTSNPGDLEGFKGPIHPKKAALYEVEIAREVP